MSSVLKRWRRRLKQSASSTPADTAEDDSEFTEALRRFQDTEAALASFVANLEIYSRALSDLASSQLGLATGLLSFCDSDDAHRPPLEAYQTAMRDAALQARAARDTSDSRLLQPLRGHLSRAAEARDVVEKRARKRGDVDYYIARVAEVRAKSRVTDAEVQHVEEKLAAARHVCGVITASLLDWFATVDSLTQRLTCKSATEALLGPQVCARNQHANKCNLKKQSCFFESDGPQLDSDDL